MIVSIYTLGCKVNTVESGSIARMLSEHGVEVVMHHDKADAYIINTCTVTNEADRKSRQMVRKCLSLNPNCKIYVLGCSVQNDASRYENINNVVYLCGNNDKQSVVSQVLAAFADQQCCDMSISPKFENMAEPIFDTTRNFIKVQDGCNNFCSYCKIPYVRGRERSRDIASIVAEAESCSLHSKEIVLTGINVSSYGSDISSSLTELILALGHIDMRKRLSSFECNIVSRELLVAMQDSGFCDSFHLSLQSGNNNVLQAMNRHYTTEQYLENVQLIREYFPNAGITTDVITGFPTETDDDFVRSIEFIKSVGFSDMHIFPYSERIGTKACALPQVHPYIRKERAKQLEVVRDSMKCEFLEKQIGRTLSVYFEQNGEGYATNYVRVYANESDGMLKDVKIEKLYKKGVR